MFKFVDRPNLANFVVYALLFTFQLFSYMNGLTENDGHKNDRPILGHGIAGQKYTVNRDCKYNDVHVYFSAVAIFTAQCTLVHSAVLGSHVVRLSVCNVCGL